MTHVTTSAAAPRKGLSALLDPSIACELRAVFTDMDGTLLLPDSTLPPQTQRVIDRLQATGVHFVPTTGRTLLGVQDPFGAQAQRISFVAGNGMDVVLDGTSLRHLEYDRATVLDLARLAFDDAEPMGMAIYNDRRGYVLEREAGYLRGRSDSLEDAPALSRGALPDGPVLKAAVITVNPVAMDVVKRFAPLMEGRIDFAPCGDHWIDALIHGVDKADGIRQVLDALGATPEQALGFGDSMNDAGMMRLLPHGVAVANAMDALKGLCAFEIGPNAEASVINALDAIAAVREQHGCR